MQRVLDSSSRRRLASIVCVSLFSLATAGTALAGAQAPPRQRDGEISGYEYTGPYIQGALSIGRIDFDGGIDSDASGGFAFGGGYRFLPWLSAEGHFQFLGGQENAEFGNTDRDSEFWAFTFGPKVYPLGLFDLEDVPETIQPYATIGIGGGEGEVEGVDDESSFVARFILGVDFWLTDHFGAFVEGGGYAVEDDDIDGAGVFSLGAAWRF